MNRVPVVVGAGGVFEQLQEGDLLAAALFVPPPAPAPVLVTFRPVSLQFDLLPRGAVVGIHPAGQGVIAAVAGGALAPGIAMAQEAINPGELGFVQTAGLFTSNDFTLIVGHVQLFPRALYFLDVARPGRLTRDPPTAKGQIVQLIAAAVSLDTLSLIFAQPVLL